MRKGQYVFSEAAIKTVGFGGGAVLLGREGRGRRREPTTTHQVRRDCPWTVLE